MQMVRIIIFLLAKLAAVSSLRDDYSDNFMWILKCCPENYILSNPGCIRNDSIEISVPAYEAAHLTRDDSMKVNFVYYKVECFARDEELFLFLPQFSVTASEIFFLQNDGRLLVPKLNASFSSRQFCLEHFEGSGIIAAVCIPGLESVIDEVSAGISLIGVSISLPFLLVTFVVYALVPERNLYGKCLMSYVFSLFWAYFLPVFCYAYGQSVLAKLLVCRITVLIYTFFFICSFFWMNVIAFDIWLTFSGNKGVSSNEKKRFIKYSIYAWGVPVLLIILIIIATLTIPPSARYSPFGEGCFLQEGIPSLLYFYGPLGILTSMNFGLFVSTAWKIIKTRHQTAMLRERGNVTHNSDNEATVRLKVYVKLMFAMGINWSVEFVEWAVTWQLGPLPFLWYLTDFCNAGLGVLIFFMFVFNKTTWKLLKKRYDMVRGRTETTQTKMTSTS